MSIPPDWDHDTESVCVDHVTANQGAVYRAWLKLRANIECTTASDIQDGWQVLCVFKGHMQDYALDFVVTGIYI